MRQRSAVVSKIAAVAATDRDDVVCRLLYGAKKFVFAFIKIYHFVRETNAPRGYYVVLDDSSKSGNSPLRDLEVERHHFENLSFRYIRKVERS